MSKQHMMIAGALALVLVVIAFPFFRGEPEPDPVPSAPPVPVPAEPSAPVPRPVPLMTPPAPARTPVSAEPPVEVVEEAPAPAEDAEADADALPALNDSDPYVLEQAQVLAPGLEPYLSQEQVLRKVVMVVDTMSQGQIPPRDRPVRGPAGDLVVRALSEDTFILEPGNYARYTPFVSAFEAIRTEDLLMVYQHSRPLLEEAYAELGYPDRDFESVLLQAITRVLNASTPSGPFELKLPSVHYEFLDERIEALSEVEKLLIRMGPENADRVRRKLQALRREILAGRNSN